MQQQQQPGDWDWPRIMSAYKRSVDTLNRFYSRSTYEESYNAKEGGKLEPLVARNVFFFFSNRLRAVTRSAEAGSLGSAWSQRSIKSAVQLEFDNEELLSGAYKERVLKHRPHEVRMLQG